MGLMLHANGKHLIKKQNYKDALDVLGMGEVSCCFTSFKYWLICQCSYYFIIETFFICIWCSFKFFVSIFSFMSWFLWILNWSFPSNAQCTKEELKPKEEIGIVVTISF